MDILCDLTLSQELFSRVSLTTIGHLRAVCRRVLSANESAIEPYAVALAFAKTRPNIGGLSLALSQWREIWAGCELAVESQEVEASSWGHAITWTDLGYEYELNVETAATILEFFVGDGEAGPTQWHE
jgi:hypothetical protein